MATSCVDIVMGIGAEKPIRRLSVRVVLGFEAASLI
jgi:hypothetical protein